MILPEEVAETYLFVAKQKNPLGLTKLILELFLIKHGGIINID